VSRLLLLTWMDFSLLFFWSWSLFRSTWNITDRPVVAASCSLSLSLSLFQSLFLSYSMSIPFSLHHASPPYKSSTQWKHIDLHRGVWDSTWTIRHGPAFTHISLVMLQRYAPTLEMDLIPSVSDAHTRERERERVGRRLLKMYSRPTKSLYTTAYKAASVSNWIQNPWRDARLFRTRVKSPTRETKKIATTSF
jgi:hypothetical protein